MSFVIPPSPEDRLKTRQQFCLVDKLRIAEYAITKGWINPIARAEGVSPTNVRRWIEQRQEVRQKVARYNARTTVNRFRLVESKRYCLKNGNGLNDLEVEAALMEFWRQRNENELPCSVWDLVRQWGKLQPDLVNVLTNNAC